MVNIWNETYRPAKLDDVILPDRLKDALRGVAKDINFPNVILTGPKGIGKTTAAQALMNELAIDNYTINASLNGNIDTLRTDIQEYASTVSIVSERKCVILDEADYLTSATQPALRNFMEEHYRNCGFILTCNYLGKIIDALQSRCVVLDFTIQRDEMPQLCSAFFKRVCTILQKEDIEYDKGAVAKLIAKHAPDWRRVLNELQHEARTYGKISSAILIRKDVSVEKLFGMLKNRSYKDIRKWAYENSDGDINSVFRKLYDEGAQYVQDDTLPNLVVYLADYQYKSTHVADQEINLAALLTEIMAGCKFK